MNPLGLSQSSSSPNAKAKSQSQLSQVFPNKLSKSGKHSQSSKDLKAALKDNKNLLSPTSIKSVRPNLTSPRGSDSQLKTSILKEKSAMSPSDHTPIANTMHFNFSPNSKSVRAQKINPPTRFTQMLEEANEVKKGNEEIKTTKEVRVMSPREQFNSRNVKNLRISNVRGDVESNPKPGSLSERNSPAKHSKNTMLVKSPSAVSIKNQFEKSQRTPNSLLEKVFSGKTAEKDLKSCLKKTRDDSQKESTMSQVIGEIGKELSLSMPPMVSETKREGDSMASFREVIKLKNLEGERSPTQTPENLKEQIRLLQKEREQDKNTIKQLQEQIFKLETLFEKSIPKGKESEGLAKSEIQEKEFSFLQIQNDTLKISIDIVKKENDILKQNQSYLLQFKEAARRYRDLANQKSAECITLAEEVINMRKERGLSTNASSQCSSPIPNTRFESVFNGKDKLLVDNYYPKSVSHGTFFPNEDIRGGESLETNLRGIDKLPQPQEACVKPVNESRY